MFMTYPEKYTLKSRDVHIANDPFIAVGSGLSLAQVTEAMLGVWDMDWIVYDEQTDVEVMCCSTHMPGDFPNGN
jgi:hypothetical protein